MRRWSAGGDAQVVQEQEPLLVQPPSEDGEDKFLEVFRPVRWSKRQPFRQVRARRNEHSHLLGSLLLIVTLIETFLEVSY